MKQSMEFNLFHRFATSELTHSGIWAWIIQSLDDDAPPELHELRPAARSLLKRMGVTEFESPVSVRRERSLEGDAGRVDIEAIDGRGRVVVIETKVSSAPDVMQRQRYADKYRSSGENLAGIAIVSTRFDEPWNDIGISHVGASDLLLVLRGIAYEQSVMRQYIAWLENTIRSRSAEVESALSSDPDECSVALQSAAAQWGVMRRLGEVLGGPKCGQLTAGQNNDGSAWTQLRFSPGAPPAFDALFYRLESWNGRAAQFTLRQYQNPADDEKVNRLRRLREMFREATVGCSVPFDTEPKRARMRAAEAKIAQVLFPQGTMAAVLTHLPTVHGTFLEQLRAAGWPLEVDTPSNSS